MSGGYLSAIGAGINQHLPSINVDLGGGFSFGLSPALAFGSNGLNISANVGLGYSSTNFSAGLNLAGGYTNMRLGENSIKGLNYRVGGGIYVGNDDYGFGLYSTTFGGAGAGQRVAGFKGNVAGVSMVYENDGAPFSPRLGINDAKDRFRTNAVSIGY